MSYNPGLPVTDANALPARLLGASGYGGGNPTYVASGTGYTAYATPTDMIAMSGSASKTVLVTNIFLQLSATSLTLMTVYFIRRVTANSGGSPTSPAAVTHDSANPAAGASVSVYNAAPTLGTSAGTVFPLGTVASAATGQGTTVGLFTGNARDSARLALDLRQPITLRGANEMLALNFGGVALPAGFVMNYVVEWVEI